MLPRWLYAAPPAGLTWLDLSHGSYNTLPPALAGATALRGLEMVDCRDLALTTHDIDNILLHMPHLHTLALDTSALPTRVRKTLRRRLPDLVITQEWSHSYFELELDARVQFEYSSASEPEVWD